METHPQQERVLVLQSAEPEIIAQALTLIHDKKLFCNPQITLFLRDGGRYRAYFSGNPYVNRVVTHTRMKKALSHLRAVRRERYDGAVLFLNGDPSYWKIRCFGFLCGAKHLLIFNENLDCFFFTPREVLRIGLDLWRYPMQPHEVLPPRMLLTVLLKLVRPLVFPFRFIYLLFYVWILNTRRPRARQPKSQTPD